jgi:hypothetical protein
MHVYVPARSSYVRRQEKNRAQSTSTSLAASSRWETIEASHTLDRADLHRAGKGALETTIGQTLIRGSTFRFPSGGPIPSLIPILHQRELTI